MSDIVFDHILHQECMETEAQRQRPFMLLRPKMYPDGAMWCALYGDNIQEGVCGFGDTPGNAAAAFDESWYRQKLQVSKSESSPLDSVCPVPAFPNVAREAK